MQLAIGFKIGRAAQLCNLAELYSAGGRTDEALSTLTEALSAVELQDERIWEAEIHRLKGELLLKKDAGSSAEARSCFERAIEIAGKQSSKSLELRATTSLARLLEREGRRPEARTMLAEVYNWFTEGFDTSDLKEAKALIDELNR